MLEDEIEKNLSYLLTHQHKDLTLVVHPILYAYLTKGPGSSKFPPMAMEVEVRKESKNQRKYKLSSY